MRCTITASLVLVAALGTATAGPHAEADRLFEEGRTLATEGQYEAACSRFAREFELDAAPGIELNLGDCHEHLGRLAEAWRRFEGAARRWERGASPDPVRARFAHERAAAVAKRLATIVIGVPEPGLEGLAIRLNGRKLAPAAEVREVLEPGAIELVARAPGKRPFVRSRKVAAGETVVIELAFSDDASPPPDPPPTPPVVDDDRGDRRRTRVRIAIGIGVASAASLAGSLAVSLYGRSQYDDAVSDRAHCDPGSPPRCDAIGSARISDAQRFTTIGSGLAIAGGVLAVGALVVYLTAPSRATITPTGVAFRF